MAYNLIAAKKCTSYRKKYDFLDTGASISSLNSFTNYYSWEPTTFSINGWYCIKEQCFTKADGLVQSVIEENHCFLLVSFKVITGFSIFSM